MIETLVRFCAILLLLIIAAVLIGSVVWAYMAAFDKVMRLFPFHRNLCEYFIYRKRFVVWLAHVRGERQTALNRQQQVLERIEATSKARR